VEGLSPEDVAALRALPEGAPEWLDVFAARVRTASASGEGDLPAILGVHEVHGAALRFAPRFPLEPGIVYRVVFHSPAQRLAEPSAGSRSGLQPAFVAEFELPLAQRIPTTVVTAIYPSASVLPENVLRFYVHFSAPMSRGSAYDYIRLLAEDGSEVSSAFLELGEELWDPSGRRFTLYLDPGRVKQELQPREELGPVLQSGGRYTLVVDGAWPDAEGVPLKAAYRKVFTAGPSVQKSVDPMAWRVEPPAARSTVPLRVRFAEPLDHALLRRLLWVEDAQGNAVEGAIEVSEEERLWSFTPQGEWRRGRYALAVDTVLEDVAGNNVGRPFEVDILDRVSEDIEVKKASVPFEVR
jgi:hypothetical protein